jgi:hypothetical protein
MNGGSFMCVRPLTSHLLSQNRGHSQRELLSFPPKLEQMARQNARALPTVEGKRPNRLEARIGAVRGCKQVKWGKGTRFKGAFNRLNGN